MKWIYLQPDDNEGLERLLAREESAGGHGWGQAAAEAEAPTPWLRS